MTRILHGLAVAVTEWAGEGCGLGNPVTIQVSPSDTGAIVACPRETMATHSLQSVLWVLVWVALAQISSTSSCLDSFGFLAELF